MATSPIATLGNTGTDLVLIADNTGEDQASTRSPDQILEELRVIVGRLSSLARDQVTAKAEVERRWLRAIRQFHGRYDPETERELIDAKKSRAFIKITRKKTNSWKGRMESLIFPTDDRNYGIQPTPLPSLTSQAKEVVEKAQALVDQANQQAQGAAASAQSGDQQAAEVQGNAAAHHASRADQHAQDAQDIDAQIKEAKKRASLMQDVMDDQLTECGYSAEGRDAILDMCLLGTGIMKGPMASEATRGKWTEQAHPETQQPSGQFVYSRETDPKPVYKRVDPWSYFPDMSARKKGEEEFEFERHLWTKKDLRRLVRERGFNTDAVRRLLDDQRNSRPLTEPGLSYLTDLRAVDGNTQTLAGRYVGWEYHGPLEAAEIVTMLFAMGDDQGAAEYMLTSDPLVEMKVICYFCDNELLKIAPEYPLDSQESLYSVVPFEAAEASMFGYGVPDVMEDSQAAINGGWRMALDNGGLSTGPQIAIDRDYIEPANGKWEVTPRKVWYKKKAQAAGVAFEVFDIPNKVNEIMAIVDTARKFADDESALPVQSEGEGTESPNQTATAVNIMALGFNVTFRSVVKAWDDGMTVPSMRRLYDWNMQHNPRDDIKGDMNVDARGTSVLLVREVQSQVLMAVVQNHTTHPILGKMLNAYEAYKKFLQSMMVPPDEIMVSKDDYDKALQQESQQAPQEDPSVTIAKINAQSNQQIAKITGDSRDSVAQIQRETALITLAEQRNMTIDQLSTQLNLKQLDNETKERLFAAELGAEQKNADQARAAGDEPTGSGGYVSLGAKKPTPAQDL